VSCWSVWNVVRVHILCRNVKSVITSSQEAPPGERIHGFACTYKIGSAPSSRGVCLQWPNFSIPLPKWIKSQTWSRLHTLTALDASLENDSPFNLLHLQPQTNPTCFLSFIINYRIHWWIRNRRRSPLPKDRSRTQRPPQQVRSHLPPFRRSSKRSRKVDCEPFALTSIRTHSLVDDLWYYDTWRG